MSHIVVWLRYCVNITFDWSCWSVFMVFLLFVDLLYSGICDRVYIMMYWWCLATVFGHWLKHCCLQSTDVHMNQNQNWIGMRRMSMLRWMYSFNLKKHKKNIRRLGTIVTGTSQLVSLRERGVDYNGLDVLNLKLVQTGSWSMKMETEGSWQTGCPR